MDQNSLQNQSNQQAGQMQQPLDQNGMPMQGQPQTQGAQAGQPQQFVPYMAFPATMKRDYDPGIYNLIARLVDQKYGAEIHEEARKFEIARVYGKLEITIFELSTWQLPPEKQQELQKLTEQGQSAGQDQQQVTAKIREYMQQNVPNIQGMVSEYMLGFQNEYLAGRY